MTDDRENNIGNVETRRYDVIQQMAPLHATLVFKVTKIKHNIQQENAK